MWVSGAGVELNLGCHSSRIAVLEETAEIALLA